MTLTYGFYDSVGGDRVYNSLQLSSIFDGIIEDGVVESIGTAFGVTPNTNMNIDVGIGRAWFHHTWSYNDAAVTLAVAAADALLPRIDYVILEIDRDSQVRANSLKMLTGTPASTPVPPTLEQADPTWQYPVAQVYVGAGVTAITANDITDLVGTAACPYVSSPLATIKYQELLYLKLFWPDEDVTAGNGKLFFMIPDFLVGDLVEVQLCVTTKSSSGAVTVQLANCGNDPTAAGTDMLSTRVTIDANEYSSLTAATPPVIANEVLTEGDFIRVDVDIAGTGTKGLDVILIVEKTT